MVAELGALLKECGVRGTFMANSMWNDKIVLVTGGTGTFGRAFVKRILREPIKKIIIFSRDELKQHEMRLHPDYQDSRIRFFLGDIRDLSRLERAFEGVDIVVHAAALKQVPATEYNPFEAVKTNIIGSQNVVDAALNKRVAKVMLISSDKAVWPINLYGATKLAAEKLFVASNNYSADRLTALSVVRYGNVIGSRGSFVELVRGQKDGGRVTITDERMTRFWIRIDQVIEMILEAIVCMQGGEIFIPKMKNLPIVDVVKLLAPEVPIDLIGIRPGEKMHETLITEHEAPRTKDAGRMYVVRPEFGTPPTWLEALPDAGQGFQFASDNRDFLLSEDEATAMFI